MKLIEEKFYESRFPLFYEKKDSKKERREIGKREPERMRERREKQREKREPKRMRETT